ncbi:MAG: DUF2800 domain-containing protein [Actinomycetota bacterium]|nr:DUF2800 domain-containing protein [Actinomycetota bacterium]
MTTPRNATTTNRGRTYKWRDEEFTSVTTILSGGVPKPALTNWAAKSVAEYVAAHLAEVNAIAADDPAAAIDLMKGSPWRQRDKAAAQGSDIHAWAEAHVLGKVMPEPPPAHRPYCDGFLRFLEDWRPTYQMSEATVYNRANAYAGTLDAIVEMDGDLWLIDYKTGKGVYGEVALQLSAYRSAEFIGLPDGTEAPMPEVDWCGVLHLTPDGYHLIPVEAGPDEFRAFLYAQQVRNFAEYRSREVLGAPLPAPEREAVPT